METIKNICWVIAIIAVLFVVGAFVLFSVNFVLPVLFAGGAAIFLLCAIAGGSNETD